MFSIRKLFGRDEADHVDTNAPQGKRTREDAYNPKPDHEVLLQRVRGDAEADAIRHAEYMVNRIFPVVEEAETLGAQRVATLGAAYAAFRSQIDAQVEVDRTMLEAAVRQLNSTEEALEEKGVPEGRTGLAPLGEGLVSRWQLLLALCVGGGAGIALARLDLTAPAIGLVVLVALALIAAILGLRIGQPETAVVTSLRRNRRREAGDVEELQAKLQHDEARATGLVKETLRLVEVEREFAKQMVATYESAASSSLPVGSMGDSERAIRKQRVPDVRVPAWVEEVEEAT